jgi:hypothetical protein
MSDDAVTTVLAKLHEFSTQALSPDERAVLGALMAPGIQWALSETEDDDEVTGFGLLTWSPESLANGLRRALANRDRPGSDAGGPPPVG